MTTGSDNNGRIARLKSSRRSFLAATVATPALLGLGVGSYEAASRLADDETLETGLLCELADNQDEYADDRTSITADPRFLSAHDLSVGQQVRFTRSDDECAVYTIAAERPEAPQDIVRTADIGRSRLALESANLADSGGEESCPEPVSDPSFSEAEFDVEVSTTVPNPSLSEAEARQQGELIERLDENGTESLFLAPHGGGIQPHTDDQAEHAAALANGSCWRTKGWGPNSGAFQRWYVPSTEISPESFPQLDSIADSSFDTAVDFGGVCGNGIVVDGSASKSVLRSVRDSINDALPSCAIETTVSDEADTSGNGLLVDQLGTESVFISQSYAARRAYWKEIAQGTAAALSDSVVSTQTNGC